MMYSLWWELIAKFINIEIEDGVVSRAYLSDIAEGYFSPQDQRNSEVIDKVNEYISGEKFSLNEIRVDLSGFTSFQKHALDEMRKIPPGETVPYSTLAISVGSQGAARAVGSVCAKNPVFLIIPCHRVVRKNGLGEYGYGTEIKEKILQHELKYFCK
ncbi:MAG: MGMT family protein [Actinobacteria bacterium]|nr:MGMT family protein [Actinomycetota bacterium]